MILTTFPSLCEGGYDGQGAKELILYWAGEGVVGKSQEKLIHPYYV